MLCWLAGTTDAYMPEIESGYVLEFRTECLLNICWNAIFQVSVVLLSFLYKLF
jgi:hypothetical protein